MDCQKQDTVESLKSLINELQNSKFNLDDYVHDIIESILETDNIEIKQPEDVKGVRQILCAIHTYKI